MSTEFSRSYTLVCISPHGEERTLTFKTLSNALAKIDTLKPLFKADYYEIYEVHKKLVWPLTS